MSVYPNIRTQGKVKPSFNEHNYLIVYPTFTSRYLADKTMCRVYDPFPYVKGQGRQMENSFPEHDFNILQIFIPFCTRFVSAIIRRCVAYI